MRAPGDRLGRYRLVRPLGAGGTGEVWEAVLHGPAGFEKSVALKLLRPGVVGPEQAQALIREARLGALLQHPNVVGTWGLDEHEGTWCVALELVRGATVADLIRAAGGGLPPGVVLDVGVQACAALAHVHGLVVDGQPAGLVHRDVKPQNLLVDRSGLVKLADLGISALPGETGVAGTPGYMAPEQLDGRAEPRSDLFSLGATLYALATGRRPFGSGRAAMVEIRQVEARLQDPAFLGPVEQVVPGLGEVLRRCLRHHPAHRFPSARALGDALARLRAHHPVAPTLLDLLGGTTAGAAGPPSTGSATPTQLFVAGNLRPPRDRFVGRERELDELEALLRGGERFVVLLGPGGMGKTRLALEAARRVQPTVRGGAWAIDLTEATSEEGVCAAVAAALGIELERRDPELQIGRVLADKGPAVVLLDNLEQCVEALPRTLGVWLDTAPEVAFLGTTRIVPGLRGERHLPIGELAPDDAVQLFHARAPRPVRDDERDAVRELCAAVEGMPLAIELTAARLRALSARDVLARLGLALLSGGGRDLPERHRSVTASLRWSWDLLSEPARGALGHLSVFEGGFLLEAAEAVLGADGLATLDLLQELIDASLLRADRGGRFSMLVVVREFAAGVAPADERQRAELRHGAHYAQLGGAEALARLRASPDAVAALARERDNLLAAWRRAVARRDGPIAIATLEAVLEVIEREGPVSLLVPLAEAVRGIPDLGPAERAGAAQLFGVATLTAGRHDEAEAHLRAALTQHEALGDEAAATHARSVLATLARERGRTPEARQLYERALVDAVRLGRRGSEARTLGRLASLDRLEGRVDDARARYEQAIALSRAIGDRHGEAVLLGNLANLCRDVGDVERGVALYEQALAIHRAFGDRSTEANLLANLGAAAFERGDLDQAEVLLRAALAIQAEIGHARAESVTLALLGGVRLDRGRPDEALEWLERGIRLRRQLRDRLGEGVLQSNLGTVLVALGRTSEARRALDEALAIHREAGARRSVVIGLANLAELERVEGRIDAAARALDEALGIAREIGAARLEGIVAAELAALSPGTDEARALLAIAHERLHTADPASIARVHVVRAEHLLRLGDRAGAARAIAEAERLDPARPSVRRELDRVRLLVSSSAGAAG